MSHLQVIDNLVLVVEKSELSDKEHVLSLPKQRILASTHHKHAHRFTLNIILWKMTHQQYTRVAETQIHTSATHVAKQGAQRN